MHRHPQDDDNELPPELDGAAEEASDFINALTTFVGEYVEEHPSLALDSLTIVPAMTVTVDGDDYTLASTLYLTPDMEDDPTGSLRVLVNALRSQMREHSVPPELIVGALLGARVDVMTSDDLKKTVRAAVNTTSTRTATGQRPGRRRRHG